VIHGLTVLKSARNLLSPYQINTSGVKGRFSGWGTHERKCPYADSYGQRRINVGCANELEKILFKHRQFYSTIGCRFAPSHDEQALHFQRRSGEE
jgi:hypothetical protein